jgi:hypothetical protein
MSKVGHRQQNHVPNKGKRSPASLGVIAIPIVVGLMVLFIVVGAILSIRNRPSASGSPAAGVSIPSDTALPLPTRSIPYPEVPRIPLQEAWEKLQQGSAVLVDVRSQMSYQKTHAAGAFSVPADEIQAHLNELPRDKDWILYCT